MVHTIKSFTTTDVALANTMRIDFYLGDKAPDSEETSEGLACSVLINTSDNPSIVEVRRRALDRANEIVAEFLLGLERDGLQRDRPAAH